MNGKTYAGIAGWVGGFIIFIMVIAAVSSLLANPTTSKTITGGANALTRLFQGVLK